ncbi:hypothetical protein BC940DRAFT_293611 [Gongronella butleri]|nr:hypothetical protein BC940DRAFT_293611 [Gongronella butleri]
MAGSVGFLIILSIMPLIMHRTPPRAVPFCLKSVAWICLSRFCVNLNHFCASGASLRTHWATAGRLKRKKKGDHMAN